MNNFEEQIKSYIPRIEAMLEKEKKHLLFLMNEKNHKVPGIEEMRLTSMRMVMHLGARLEQYKNYKQ